MHMQYSCQYKGRVAALRAMSPPSLNGIEYLEVSPDQTQIEVHFVHDLSVSPSSLTASNVKILGGVRVRDPKVKSVEIQDDVLIVRIDSPGDFSPYVLRLAGIAGDDRPPEGFDPALAQIEFRFKVDCPSNFDCRESHDCPLDEKTQPQIDYLAKDYGSFRRLMLDRLAALMPDWRERSPADLWVALTEAIAFRADELSYFQDAVATEAYLGTARQRVSVRRHCRLLDYPFHDGCNARTWVCFTVDECAENQKLAGCDELGLGGTLLLTRIKEVAPGPIDETRAESALDRGEAQAFELLHSVTLFRAHNEMQFYTWSDEECCLPKGATRAFLLDEQTWDPTVRLRLRVGDVLVFAEVKSPDNGAEADADPGRRHAVRLSRVDPPAPLEGNDRGVPVERDDPVTGRRFVEIEWDAKDALPFALCISKRIAGQFVTGMSVAWGNVALVDHGHTVAEPRDGTLPAVENPARYRPLLQRTMIAPLTQQRRVHDRYGRPRLFDESAPASAAFPSGLALVKPAIHLRSGAESWSVRRDLLGSDRLAAEFVVETQEDYRAFLRFGDDVNGLAPNVGDRFTARYRIGNGSAGNVGADTIAHIVSNEGGISHLRNPMPARDGTDPHSILHARLCAPQAFRTQERAVTAEDYAQVAQRHPQVQRAVATRRWTGSWHTMFITIDRFGGGDVDAQFEEDLVRFLERYRLAGHDVEIDAPRFVPLDLAFEVCAKPGYFVEDVERRLLARFGAQARAGFFHPDNFSFGDAVYLSALVAPAMSVAGVEHVTPLRFQKLGRAAAGEMDEGVIRMARLEIAQLENDPNAPEKGRIVFEVHEEAHR